MNQNIISHKEDQKTVEDIVEKIKQRIIKQGDQPGAPVDEVLRHLDNMKDNQVGQYLLKNSGGWNGFWTNYFLTYPLRNKFDFYFRHPNDSDLSSFEQSLFSFPLVKATQQRFQIFLEENQKLIKEGVIAASIPSGLFGELLYLDYTDIRSCELHAIDLDMDSLVYAKQNAIHFKLDHFVHYGRKDAWELGCENKFDFISSNGLNIYESDENRVIELYKGFYKAIKPGGKLITSYIETPPHLNEYSAVKVDKLDVENLKIQKIVMIDILQSTWANFCTQDEMFKRLEEAGFKNIKIRFDDAHMFPTIIASK
jgi:hypothetical protein